MVNKPLKANRWRDWLKAVARFLVIATCVFVLSSAITLFVSEVIWIRQTGVPPRGVVIGLEFVAWGIVAVALLYGIAFVVAAIRYLWQQRHPKTVCERQAATTPNLRRSAIIYLCCGDLEYEALAGLSQLKYDGPLIHILHDDSEDAHECKAVDAAVADMQKRFGVYWLVLRRFDKGGGKSAVTNYVLDQTSADHDLFLLADNDSFAHDPQLLMKAVPFFDDDSIGVIQFRNVAEYRGDEVPFNRLLAPAIDMFDAFMTGLYQGLWQPFVGHNALLRTRDVIAAGGFTPGVFADDIDLTIRMNRAGKRVEYRRELEMAEFHPPNYRAFCARSSKWATGCMQVLRMHGLRILMDRNLSLAQKTGFFLFGGFYLTQAAIMAYVLIVLVLLPLLTVTPWRVTTWSLAFGTLLPVAIFFPVLVYLRTEGRHLPFWKTLAACASTYGSTDWFTLRGLVQGLRHRQTTWAPTNGITGSKRPVSDWVHFGCGLLVLCIPLAIQPQLLFFPITWLFAAKLIFVPAVAAHYRQPTGSPPPQAPSVRHPSRRSPTLAVFTLALPLMLLGTLKSFGADDHAGATTRKDGSGATLKIDGEAVVIKGIHYSPWRPGTGPGKGFAYPDEVKLRQDLELIRQTGANTILTYDPPETFPSLAEEYGLSLIYTFHIQWWQLPAGKVDEISDQIETRVAQLRDQSNIIAWMLGNEIDGWVLDEMGVERIRDILSTLRQSILKVDPRRPVCYGNYTLHRTLGLDDDMDLVAYNIYPFYPTEVAAMGYERFISKHIMPLTGGRPVLITEFGINSLEASEQRQAEVLQECWKGLLAAGCQGGIVFSFADEWWKNYDNPVIEPDWWRREEAPNDHLRHDRDPEEHYGIVYANRDPKPAYDTVREMFGATETTFFPVPTPELDRSRNRSKVLWVIGALAVFSIAAAAVLMCLHAESKQVKHEGEM